MVMIKAPSLASLAMLSQRSQVCTGHSEDDFSTKTRRSNETNACRDMNSYAQILRSSLDEQGKLPEEKAIDAPDVASQRRRSVAEGPKQQTREMKAFLLDFQLQRSTAAPGMSSCCSKSRPDQTQVLACSAMVCRVFCPATIESTITGCGYLALLICSCRSFRLSPLKRITQR